MSEEAITNQYVGLVIGVLAAVILLLVVVIFIIIGRNRRRKHTTPHTIFKPVDNQVTINMKVNKIKDCFNIFLIDIIQLNNKNKTVFVLSTYNNFKEYYCTLVYF